jgi:hydrogenase maturation factor
MAVPAIHAGEILEILKTRAILPDSAIIGEALPRSSKSIYLD